LVLPFFSVASQPEGLLFNRNKEPLVKTQKKKKGCTKRIKLHAMELMRPGCVGQQLTLFIAGPLR
jgi:hypothetical protein